MRHPRRFTPLLLLALWLNTCLGWSWHEAAHLRQALEPEARTVSVNAAVATGVLDEGSPSASVAPEASPEDTAPSHGACAACLAFAHLQATAPQSPQPLWPHKPCAFPRPVEKAEATPGRRASQPFLARAPPADSALAPAASVEAA